MKTRSIEQWLQLFQLRSFQFYSPIRDYTNIDSQAPKFKEDK